MVQKGFKGTAKINILVGFNPAMRSPSQGHISVNQPVVYSLSKSYLVYIASLAKLADNAKRNVPREHYIGLNS